MMHATEYRSPLMKSAIRAWDDWRKAQSMVLAAQNQSALSKDTFECRLHQIARQDCEAFSSPWFLHHLINTLGMSRDEVEAYREKFHG